jgi:hypothetical protein
MKQPGSDRWDDDFLFQQLRQVVVRLHNARTPPALEPGLCLSDDAGNQRAKASTSRSWRIGGSMTVNMALIGRKGEEGST